MPPTSAQIAYAAYAAVLAPLAPWGTPAFAELPELHQHAWEAVAEALRTAQARFAVGQHVTWDEAPGAIWQIIERRQHEGPERTWRTYDLLPAAGDLTDFRPLSAEETALEAAEEC